MIEPSPYAARGYQLLKFEPHLHTLHSDGRHGVAAMFEACKLAGYSAVALTDHNTISGLSEARTAADRLGLILVPGVEVTTFRGHAVALGVSRAPEWRDLETRGADLLANEIRVDGGLVSVAHPAALGSPVCSGCAWAWPIDPASVDLWEVFSAPRPHTDAAQTLWRQLLKRNARVAPVAAGDVHSIAAAGRARGATFVFVREASTAGVLEALHQRRAFASTGPLLDFWLEDASGNVALIGERVDSGTWTPRVPARATVEEIETTNGERCVYAELRDVHGKLEAVSAPIWIDTSQRGETSV